MNDINGRTDPASAIEAMAEAVTCIAAAVDTYQQLAREAEQAVAPYLPVPAATLGQGSPLNRIGSLQEFVEGLDGWVVRLRDLAGHVSTRLSSAAEAMRHHTVAVAARVDQDQNDAAEPTAQRAAAAIRGGLGGVIGDYAAAMDTDVVGGVADLLDLISKNVPRNSPLFQRADEVAQAYLASRAHDDETRTY